LGCPLDEGLADELPARVAPAPPRARSSLADAACFADPLRLNDRPLGRTATYPLVITARAWLTAQGLALFGARRQAPLAQPAAVPNATAAFMAVAGAPASLPT
jgi:hypothetical protein